ncbi:MAG: Fic family protein [Flavobacteriales bacterium]|nr:Fic family protein [Flavobacteriales bacterium]
MDEALKYYMTPDTMEPLFPEPASGELEELAIELISKAGKLSGVINPETRKAIGEFLRPMNSYYSNLIEGHDTHPIDIARALNEEYSDDKAKRDLQLEAYAHIKLHKNISEEIKAGNSEIIPTSMDFLKSLHKRFYDHLPESFKEAISKQGEPKIVIPGEFRTCEVQVGRHIAPYSKNIDLFTNRFEEFYNPKSLSNKSKTRRIISIAASHHRLAWIHPFLDGNGRVTRLFSDACFMHEDLDADGLWSISRGLARRNDEYKSNLAQAGSVRYNDYDGRGNLSNKKLIEFCKFFLEVAVDQTDYMFKMIDTNNILSHIESFTDLMVNKGELRPEAKFILCDLFLKGKISKSDAMRITNTSDKTVKITTDKLTEMGFISPEKRKGTTMMYHVSYPVKYSPMIFPGLYPGPKEVEMYKNA